MNKILFDASSTNPISEVIAVAEGDCILINAWNLGPGEVAEVFRLLVQTGEVPTTQAGSCSPIPAITPSSILQEDPYVPCNAPVQVGQTPTQNITSIVLSQPGYYNLHLTPAALGTAFVEAVVLTGPEACQQAAAACCCTPQQNWAGTSLSPCLTITPGGPNGLQPTFDLDPCCVLQQIVTPGVPNLADTIIVLQGGACVRVTLQDVVDLVFVCGTLGTFPLGAVAPLDSVVVVDMAANCKRLDLAVAVIALETPWGGVSTNPFLTITPGGVNGHAPTFGYDWCLDMQALPSCTCEPIPGDLVPIIQGGTCVLATWPEVDACAQMGAFPIGALIAGDNVFVREAGGACKQVPASDFTASVVFPLLAPDGSCASPSYSFSSSPDSGLWYNTINGAVTLSDDNCADLIEVGASITLTSSTSNISMSAPAGSISHASATFSAVAALGIALTASTGDVIATASLGEVNLTAATNVEVRTASILRVAFDVAGAWNLAGNPGVAGQVITSAGPGLPPTWAAASATVTFPLLAPTSATPQYSFVAQTGMGMAMDGAQLHFGSLDTLSPVWSVSSRLSIDTGVTGDMFLYGSRGDGSRGANLLIHGGDALNPGVQVEGGGVQVLGGNSSESNGGTVTLGGGSSSGVGTGGNAVVLAGNGFNTGGSVLVTAGTGSQANPTGGHIRLRTNNGAAGTANIPAITMDHHGSVQYGDPYVFASSAFSNGVSFWYGVAGDTVTTRGGSIRIWGGPGLGSGGGGHGGDLDFMGGNATGGPANNGGQLFLHGGALTGTGIKGYVQLERVNAAPVAAPNLTAGFAPIVLFDDGANIHLFAWSVGAGAWQDVTLT